MYPHTWGHWTLWGDYWDSWDYGYRILDAEDAEERPA